jgi:hypothetical protein
MRLTIGYEMRLPERFCKEDLRAVVGVGAGMEDFREAAKGTREGGEE